MQRDSVSTIVCALNACGARYLIAGGLAVVAHGYVRLTADLDLILDLEDEEATRRALEALAGLEYMPRAPVPIAQFALAQKRAEWITEKGIKVFSLSSSLHPATEIDLFVEPPIAFNEAYARAMRAEVAPGAEASFLGYEDLLFLKKKAGRSQDLLDIEKLQSLRRERGHD